MRYFLGALNNVLYVFLLRFASFLRHYVCKKLIFVAMSVRDRKDVHFT